MKKDPTYLLNKKQQGQKIAALTCYDYPMAVLEDKAGIDVLFVGDSVGTNILGYTHEQEVTMEDILHHLRAVKRGVSQAFILADLPYASYETPEQALKNAQRLVDNGADSVKLEGLKPEIIRHLLSHSIPVCGHLGLQPQTHQEKAVRGKTFEQAKTLIQDAQALEALGIFMLVLELIPEELAQIISTRIRIPTIGIGAGRFTDGQVLIVNDILGITPRKLRLAKQYQNYQELTLQTLKHYIQDVEQHHFPTPDNARPMPSEELETLHQWLQQTPNRNFGTGSEIPSP